MEDTFRVRVDKVFGSLTSSSSSSPSSLRSLWSLTDEEVERRKWNREDNSSPDRGQGPSNIDGGFVFDDQGQASKKNLRFEDAEDELEDLDDIENDDDSFGGGPRGDDDDEWEIRSSIGVDCTLDKEEEEDEYDKVAVGKETSGERLFMSDVKDYDVGVNSHNVIPGSFKDAGRDPRANHVAAEIRLKEDLDAAKFSSTPQASDKTAPAVVGTQVKLSEGVNLKPILKRKEDSMTAKGEKRVRFDSDCKLNSEKESVGDKDIEMETGGSMVKEVIGFGKDFELPMVPDYIRNPSRYTCYTLEKSSEMNEGSNQQAYSDFINQLKKPSTTETQANDSSDLPKAIAFTPKRKISDPAMLTNQDEFRQVPEKVGKEPMLKKGLPIGIVAEDDGEEVCMMDEDDKEPVVNKGSSTQRAGRQFRRKVEPELDETID